MKRIDVNRKIGPITAIIVILLVVLWIFLGEKSVIQTLDNGELLDEHHVETSKEPTTDIDDIKQVQATRSTAKIISNQLTVSGTTKASDMLVLRASFPGKITKIPFKKGDIVTKGESVLSIDTRVLNANILKIRTLIEERELRLKAATHLTTQNLSSKITLASAKSALLEAKANLQKLLIDFENAKIRAPFSGILNDITVSVGEILQVGDSVASLISLSPLIITAQIPQKNIHQITLGTSATVNIDSQKTLAGNIVFINRIADKNTRSVAVEIHVANQNNRMPAGISATMILILGEQLAHSFSPALLTLNNAGKTAIKIINKDNIVEINPVNILRSNRDHVWVSGLPSNVNIITVGQGFVRQGEQVIALYNRANRTTSNKI